MRSAGPRCARRSRRRRPPRCAAACSAGQLAEARALLTEAMEQAKPDPDQLWVAAVSANRLAATYTLLGDGEQGMELGRWALGTGTLEAAPRARTRVVIAGAATQVRGPRG